MLKRSPVISMIFFAFTLSVSLPGLQPSFAFNEISAAAIFAQQSDAVVLIAAVLDEKTTRLGSGFFVSSEGLILTNYHIIKDAKRIVVKLKNNKGFTDVRIITFYEKKDIAFLKINGSGFKTVRLGNSDALCVGERVIAIGNPLGLERTLSDGLVSAIRTMADNIKLIQISVPISHGSSGGPLFNQKGEVVGITAAGNIKGENLNFAVPINYARPFITNYKYSKKRISAQKQKALPRSPQAGTQTGFITYEIKPYETLYGLAKKFNTSVSEISAINKLTDSNLYIGQQIKIPTAEKSKQK